ncbi:hypothetical protein [Tateyamaria sp.]|uniref:hypothetical protein n=1 Tax=Tateyamaria sp. TaxID=1929288 RepID=UPI00329D5D09
MRFDYGDVVKITAGAPAKFFKFGESGSVCGIDETAKNDDAREFGVAKDTPLHLVEFPSGEAIEVPEIYLNLL